jgi:3-oxoadipate enol-lactonase
MFADVNGTSIYYELQGPTHGPVLALCHSLGTDSSLWDRQIAATEDAFGGIRVLRYDVRGHGRSFVGEANVSVQLLASDFLALLDQLGIERVDFAGVSIGGLVGQWLGSSAPDRISHLVLSNTAAQIGTTEMWNTRIATVTERGLAAIAEAAIGRAFSSVFIERERETAERFRRLLLDTPVAGYVSACEAIRDADLRPLARNIAVPTLVVAGDIDPVTTTEDATWLVDNIPSATMITLHAAHLANVEAASEFNDAVRQFISDS